MTEPFEVFYWEDKDGWIAVYAYPKENVYRVYVNGHYYDSLKAERSAALEDVPKAEI